MKALIFLTLLSALAGACSGKDTTSEDQASESSLELAGRVLLPRPVNGATVFAVDPDEPEVILAQGTTDQDGAFTLEVPGDNTAQVLQIVVAGPGEYVELASGATVQLPDETLLSALVEPSELRQDQVIIIDPFSSLAACLAHAWHDQGKSTLVLDPSWPGVTSQANSRFSTHLARPEGAPAIPFVVPFDPSTATTPWPSANSVLGLASASLSWVAVHGETDDAAAPTVHLVAQLCQDLEDGMFDGEQTRYLLAQAAHEFLASPKNKSGILGQTVAQAGEFYEDVSTHDQAPWGKNPALFDPYPPEVWFKKAPAELATVCDPFEILVEATDNQKIDSLMLFSTTINQRHMAQTAGNTGTATLQLTLDPAQLDVTGQVQFTASATDPAKNSATAQRNIIADGFSPQFVTMTPDLGACISIPPQKVQVVFQDKDGTDGMQVTFQIHGQVTTCQPAGIALWECSPDLASGGDFEVLAQDPCGRTASFKGTLCIDDTPPQIQFSTPDGAFYNTESAQVTVSASDSSEITQFSVQLNDEVVCEGRALNSCPVQLPLPEDPADVLPPALVVAYARDEAGNNIELSAAFQADVVPPDISTALTGTPIFPGLEEVAVLITASDGQSPEVEVQALSPQGAFSVQQQDDNLYTALPSGAQLPDNNLIQVTVLATDLAGNTTQEELTVWVDDTDPLVWQEPRSFLNEADALVTLDQGTLKPIYSLEGAELILLTQASCEQTCPSFTKLASRLEWESQQDEKDNNLPVFSFGFSDNCPPPEITAAPSLTLRAAFYNQDELLKEETWMVDGCGPELKDIPFALPFFTPEEPQQDIFSDAAVPDRLELSATDLSGRTTTRSMTLDVNIKSPPLFSLPPQAGDAPDDPVASFIPPATLALHDLAEQGGVLSRVLLVNPYPIPIQAHVTHVPRENVMVQARQSYVQFPDPPSACGTPGTCAYKKGNAPWTDCDTPEVFSVEDILVAESLPTVLRLASADGQQVQFSHEGDSLVVEPQQTVYLDVMTDYATVGLSLPQPQELEVSNGLYSAYDLSTQSSEAVCTFDMNPGTLVASYNLPLLLVLYASSPGAQSLLQLSTTAGPAASWESLTTNNNWAALYLAPFPVYSSPKP